MGGKYLGGREGEMDGGGGMDGGEGGMRIGEV